MELYYAAFFELTTCRFIGMAAGPIPWNIMWDYCIALELSESQRDDLMFLVRAMDNTYLEHSHKEANK